METWESFFEGNRLGNKKTRAMILEVKNKSNIAENENGLQRLVAYYQSLFERDENINYYSLDDYQDARRKFVKYLLKSRGML